MASWYDKPFPERRALAAKMFTKAARIHMHANGFAHDWIDKYVSDLADQIFAAADDEELAQIRDRVIALRTSPPPVAWMGA